MDIGGPMKIRKSLTAIQRANQAFTIHPKSFVFLDRKTGTHALISKRMRMGACR
jgi:hypothetical protein